MVRISLFKLLMDMNLTSLLLEIDIEKHLKDRGLDLKKSSAIIDKKSGLAHFIVYNFSGQLVGYQRYNPLGSKKNGRNLGDGLDKYYTYITKEGPKTGKLAVWGLETLKESSKLLFIVEGIFDAVKVHNAGYPCVAVLGNNPKVLKSWLYIIPQRIIAVIDKDPAGRKLAKLADKAVTVPEPYHDLGDMPQNEATKFIKNVIGEK